MAKERKAKWPQPCEGWVNIDSSRSEMICPCCGEEVKEEEEQKERSRARF
jgi:hypothetical protein